MSVTLNTNSNKELTQNQQDIALLAGFTAGAISFIPTFFLFHIIQLGSILTKAGRGSTFRGSNFDTNCMDLVSGGVLLGGAGGSYFVGYKTKKAVENLFGRLNNPDLKKN